VEGSIVGGRETWEGKKKDARDKGDAFDIKKRSTESKRRHGAYLLQVGGLKRERGKRELRRRKPCRTG